MGKQTAVAMTDEDEEAFLVFLRGIAEIKLLENSAPTREEIWVDEFSPREEGHWQYHIWNMDFPWTVEYGQVDRDETGKRNGWYYVSNRPTAPLIEYDRHNFKDKTGRVYGRIYWAKWFAAPEGLSYDVDAFSRWYNRIVRWIRKHGSQESPGALNTYYLPDAWSKFARAP